jgi:hypothetical protein
MAMTVAEHDTAVAAYRQTLTVIQQQIHSTVPGLASGIRPCIDRPQLRLASDNRVWLLSPLRCDPLTGPGGRYVLPPSAVADLRRIAAAGIEFHTMVVGHEIDRNGPARQLIPQLRDGPKSCLPDLARALVGPVPADPQAAQLARCMGRAITAVTRRVPALAREAAGRLDPVIFGLIGVAGRLEPGRPALWVACTKWEW